MIFWKMSQLIFIEKPMENHDFWILEIPKIVKTLIFPWFFAKMKFLTSSPLHGRKKKIFRSGSGGPKMLFNTILWYAAIKIWHRLIRFLHFWWFDFFHFLAAKNHIFKKMQFCNIFLPISSILLIFCYFLRFLSPKSISFIKILIFGFR